MGGPPSQAATGRPCLSTRLGKKSRQEEICRSDPGFATSDSSWAFVRDPERRDGRLPQPQVGEDPIGSMISRRSTTASGSRHTCSAANASRMRPTPSYSQPLAWRRSWPQQAAPLCSPSQCMAAGRSAASAARSGTSLKGCPSPNTVESEQEGREVARAGRHGAGRPTARAAPPLGSQPRRPARGPAARTARGDSPAAPTRRRSRSGRAGRCTRPCGSAPGRPPGRTP